MFEAFQILIDWNGLFFLSFCDCDKREERWIDRRRFEEVVVQQKGFRITLNLISNIFFLMIIN